MNIVKHLQAFPEDNIEAVIENVFAVDYHNDQATKLIHGMQ